MAALRARIGENGRLVIPAEVRRALGIETGTEVVLVPAGKELRLVPAAQAVKNAQAIVRRHVRKGRRLSNELLTERRREAARE